MPLVSSKDILTQARRDGYAVGSFNIFNMESAKAVIAAAEQERAPVLLQIWTGLDQFVGLDVLAAIALCEGAKASVPVCVHLDHGMLIEDIAKALKCGIMSVMMDGSALSYEGNVRITKLSAQMAHGAGVPIEGEIGHVGGAENGANGDEIVLTREAEALRFAEETGVDFLAVSIGTSHGNYASRPTLNLDLLDSLAQKIPLPLVMHGSSYTPDEMLAESAKRGISKINVATELSDIVIKETLALGKSSAQVQYANQITDGPYGAMTALAASKIRLFGGSGKA